MSRGDERADAALELASVQHLVALGYVDPWEVAAQGALVQRELQQKLKQAEAELEAGNVGASIELLESVVEADAEWATPRHLLARAYFRAGRREETSAQLAWLEYHAVEHAELSLMRAKLALQRRDLNAARGHAAYAKCLLDPLPAADLIIGEVDLRRGAMADAETAYRAALASKGPHAAAYAGLAAIALRRGAWEESVDLALQAIEKDPLLGVAHCRLGIALVMLLRAPEATAALETAAALNPWRAGPYRWLARLAAAQGEVEVAAHRRQQAAARVASRRAARREQRVND